MKLHEIKDDEPELTHGQKLMMSMIKKTMPHGLKLRRVDDWNKTHRDVEVTGVTATSAMAGNPLLQVRVNADWERPAESKVNNQLINDDDINEWTIKKQEDGTFLMLQKKYIKEDAGEPLVLSMLRRLDPMVKAMRVYYKSTASEQPKLLYSWEVEPPFMKGHEEALGLSVASPRWDDARPWKASLLFSRLNDYTIKSEGEGDQKVWIIQRKDSVDESAEWPLLVSMLKRTIADHFKNGGPPVKIFDSEYHTEPVKVNGYQLLPSGALIISVVAPATGYVQQLMYPKKIMDAGKLYFQKGSNGRLLIASNEAD